MVGATFLEHFCNMLAFSIIFTYFYDGFEMVLMCFTCREQPLISEMFRDAGKAIQGEMQC